MSRKRKTGFKLVLADTGVLYALSDQDDGQLEQAKVLLQRLRDEGGISIRIPVHVTLELHRLRLYRKPFQAGAAWEQVNQLLERFDLEQASAEDFDLAWSSLRRFPDQRISLADALTAQMALRLEARVLTFDRHFLLLGAMMV